ncbi:outer membrane protein assembly factor BamA [Enterovirga aerilata]|uniref:Outer membrane protein assembly factor BamA n=1 Tax=Enterovirga aerilata TaxID=2730920 RepID=A0A849IF29_9HYPH|nr:outer membrane protein assembly factor BamA [Enterovirga sp. DB1703]NNM72493.1 outer membrane protein assembly factor BamA [Enterovirga sp. DB1703]
MMLMKTVRRFKSASLAAAVLAMAVLGGGVAFAQEIVVQGNGRVDAETVRSYVTGSGSLEEARRNMIQSGMFSDVRLSRQGNRIVVNVREAVTVNRVVVEGNRKLNKDALEGDLQTKARRPFNQATVDADVARLKEIYARIGRAAAKVSARTVDLPNGRVDVVFTVDEGGKTGVAEINFVGNEAFSSRRLRELMNTTEMNFLSFLKTNDVYDPEKIAQDAEIIRRHYLKNGYADFQLVSTDVRYDEAKEGYVITFTVSEGQQYRVGSVGFDSRVEQVSPDILKDEIETQVGEVYNAEDVEKTLSNMTNAAVRRGQPFVIVRPTGARNPATHTVDIGFVVEEGPRVYIERINVRGNTRTRDYVVRRELDIGEGDPFNKVLMDRAERRLNGLGYFKKVRITTEPGSSADRVVVNIDVEDQPTGAFSISGGYSTSDGAIGEVAVSESNFLGRGQFVRLAGQIGQRSNGVDFSFTEPYFLGYRFAAGFDLFSKYSDQTQYSRYENRTTGGQIRIGLPLTEESGVTLRYSLYEQSLKIPNTTRRPFNDCSVPIPGYTTLNPNGTAAYPACAYDGEASIAVKESQGSTLTSLAGLTLAYNTVNDLRNPRNGLYAEAKPEFAGLGGDSNFFRISGEARYYHEIYEDIVGLVKIQGGHIEATGRNRSSNGLLTFGGDLRLVDHFFLGPTLVRGFAPSGIGPRDISTPDSAQNALGGTTYIGGTLEAQFPIPLIPRDLGLKGAVFADAGTLFGYRGPRGFDVTRDGLITCGVATIQPECVDVRDRMVIRSSVGASILWNSPLGPIRFDYAYALSKDEGVIRTYPGVGPVRVGQDQTQAFRFSGGTRF